LSEWFDVSNVDGEVAVDISQSRFPCRYETPQKRGERPLIVYIYLRSGLNIMHDRPTMEEATGLRWDDAPKLVRKDTWKTSADCLKSKHWALSLCSLRAP
jgi:hypothetical protein